MPFSLLFKYASGPVAILHVRQKCILGDVIFFSVFFDDIIERNMTKREKSFY